MVPNFSACASSLDVAALTELFRTFHNEADTYVKQESERLVALEGRTLQMQKRYQECQDTVRGFLDEFAVEEQGNLCHSDSDSSSSTGVKKRKGKKSRTRVGDAADTARNISRETYSKKLLPQFLKFVVSDQRAMKDAVDLLKAFVQRHFRNSKELSSLCDQSSPLPLFRSLLRVLVAEVGVKGVSRGTDDLAR